MHRLTIQTRHEITPCCRVYRTRLFMRSSRSGLSLRRAALHRSRLGVCSWALPNQFRRIALQQLEHPREFQSLYRPSRDGQSLHPKLQRIHWFLRLRSSPFRLRLLVYQTVSLGRLVASATSLSFFQAHSQSTMTPNPAIQRTGSGCHPSCLLRSRLAASLRRSLILFSLGLI